MNDMQLRFVTEYLVDQNATRAAIRAGYAPRSASSTASRLLDDPEIQEAIAAQRVTVATAAGVSVESLLGEAEEARKIAEDAGNASAMVAALTLKAKLMGALDDRSAPATPAPNAEDVSSRLLARVILTILREAQIEGQTGTITVAAPGETLVRVKNPDTAALIGGEKPEDFIQ